MLALIHDGTHSFNADRQAWASEPLCHDVLAMWAELGVVYGAVRGPQTRFEALGKPDGRIPHGES
jgi:hypothetical protein